MYIVNQATLTIIMILSILGTLILSFILFLVQFIIEGRRLRREALASKARRLRSKINHKEVVAPELPSPSTLTAATFFHVFLSHVWGTGQDQMRIVKQRLLEMIPNLSCFLDVDDLEEIGDLEGYIDRTSTILIYCSRGYFTSKNCMRELVSSTVKQKPIIALVDLEASRGGLTLEEVQSQLVDADAFYDKWAFNNESDAPRAKSLYEHLTAYESIEWNRIGHFQDVTMRLIAERLLAADAAGTTYVDREIISRKREPLSPPSSSYHVYCSELNLGAKELVAEVSRERDFTVSFDAKATNKMPNRLYVTTDIANLAECDHMMLYLNGQTWTRGEASAAFGDVLQKAMEMDVHVQLAHEMCGVGGQEARFGCDFGTFFGHPDGATPQELLERGIYSEIAVPLKGGAWREASMALMAMALGMSKVDIAKEEDGADILGLNGTSQVRVRRVIKSATDAKRNSEALLIEASRDVRRKLRNIHTPSTKAVCVSSHTSSTSAQSVAISVGEPSVSADSLELTSAASSPMATQKYEDVYTAQKSFVETQSRGDMGLNI